MVPSKASSGVLLYDICFSDVQLLFPEQEAYDLVVSCLKVNNSLSQEGSLLLEHVRLSLFELELTNSRCKIIPAACLKVEFQPLARQLVLECQALSLHLSTLELPSLYHLLAQSILYDDGLAPEYASHQPPPTQPLNFTLKLAMFHPVLRRDEFAFSGRLDDILISEQTPQTKVSFRANACY